MQRPQMALTEPNAGAKLRDSSGAAKRTGSNERSLWQPAWMRGERAWAFGCWTEGPFGVRLFGSVGARAETTRENALSAANEDLLSFHAPKRLAFAARA